MKIYILILLSLFFYFSCKTDLTEADIIVNRCIEAHGGEYYENSIISFDFRDRHYRLERDHGRFAYHRIFNDSTGQVHDLLTIDGFVRLVNDREVELSADRARRYGNSVNSVAYFALLPSGLNDPAVNKNIIGEEEVEGNQYHKIQVTFNEDGGGEDHDDIFVYWINKVTYRMEYFGYSYLTDGGGIRFRKAFNTREMAGILLNDYLNYQSQNKEITVGDLAGEFKQGRLELLSEIRIENPDVRRNSIE